MDGCHLLLHEAHHPLVLFEDQLQRHGLSLTLQVQASNDEFLNLELPTTVHVEELEETEGIFRRHMQLGEQILEILSAKATLKVREGQVVRALDQLPEEFGEPLHQSCFPLLGSSLSEISMFLCQLDGVVDENTSNNIQNHQDHEDDIRNEDIAGKGIRRSEELVELNPVHASRDTRKVRQESHPQTAEILLHFLGSGVATGCQNQVV
mmetsp:Transcript_70411/g.152968  ORF Transcript_70411/g.152968 Transcript_70411/m.152968 type:complete len:208 (-) Transcript_70411:1346-1969(-)